jgi:predicted GIY-YIG superfamily endonuclease
MAFHVYMLLCQDGSFYVGHTDALEARLSKHVAGEIPRYTQRRRPVTPVWSEEFPTRYEAMTAERQIKGWSRAKKQALIDENWALISDLSHRHGPSSNVDVTKQRGVRGSTNSPRTEIENPALGGTESAVNPVRPEPVEGRTPLRPLTDRLQNHTHTRPGQPCSGTSGI